MAEQEVIKHTKKVYKIWGSEKHNFWEKLREFLVEIVIIVFAVSLSIWLHERSEHSHQQQEVKAFLFGLREDLKNDIKEMGEDKKSFYANRGGFGYLANLRLNETINRDSVLKYKQFLRNTTSLLANNGRFEGFKSSGRIGNIEDLDLQNDIMEFYTENLPSLLLSTNLYTQQKLKFMDVVSENLVRLTDSTTNEDKVLVMPRVYNHIVTLSNVKEIIDRYDTCINKAKKIMGRIDNRYGR